jgi:hypothetical protein
MARGRGKGKGKGAGIQAAAVVKHCCCCCCCYFAATTPLLSCCSPILPVLLLYVCSSSGRMGVGDMRAAGQQSSRAAEQRSSRVVIVGGYWFCRQSPTQKSCVKVIFVSALTCMPMKNQQHFGTLANVANMLPTYPAKLTGANTTGKYMILFVPLLQMQK